MRIYLDTNIFIAAFERRDALSDQLGQLFTCGTGRPMKTFVTSELTLSELLVVPLRDGNRTLASYYDTVMSDSGWVHVSAVARTVLVSAARLRAGRHGLKIPDAIHLATAQAEGCSHFLTEDDGLTRTAVSAVSNLRMQKPDETTLTALMESLSV